MESGQAKIESLLKDCPDYVHSEKYKGPYLQPHEKYFFKQIAYRDFELHIRHFSCNGDTVVAADIQFKRSSHFPAPFLNRNRSLVNKLRKLLKVTYSSAGIQVEDDEGGRQIHYNVSSNFVLWYASTPFEKWESECAIYDEPFSSGQTSPDDTSVRNDFVILRFRRKPGLEAALQWV